MAQAEKEVVVEHAGTDEKGPDAGKAAVAPCQHSARGDDLRHRYAEKEHSHGVVERSQAREGVAEQHAEAGCDDACAGDGEPGRQAEPFGGHARNVGADTHEGPVGERELARDGDRAKAHGDDDVEEGEV